MHFFVNLWVGIQNMVARVLLGILLRGWAIMLALLVGYAAMHVLGVRTAATSGALIVGWLVMLALMMMGSVYPFSFRVYTLGSIAWLGIANTVSWVVVVPLGIVMLATMVLASLPHYTQLQARRLNRWFLKHLSFLPGIDESGQLKTGDTLQGSADLMPTSRVRSLFGSRQTEGAPRRAATWDTTNGDRVILGAATREPRSRHKVPLIYYRPAAHLITVSGSGGGKTASVVVPNLLHWTGGSAVVMDPKGELLAATAGARQRLGHKVFRLAPGEATSSSIDVMEIVDPRRYSTPLVIANAKRIVTEWIMPEPEGGLGQNKVFFDTARNIIQTQILVAVAQWYHDQEAQTTRPTIGDVYDAISEAEHKQKLAQLYKELVDNPDRFGEMTRTIRNYIGNLVKDEINQKQDKGGGEVWESALNDVNTHMAFINQPSIRRVICGQTEQQFHPEMLFDGKTTLYLNFDMNILLNDPELVRLTIGTLMSTALNAPQDRMQGQCLYVLDEIQRLGKFGLVHQTALEYGRGKGVLMWAFIQSSAQLDAQAGEGTFASWKNSAMVQQYFFLRSVEGEAEKLSKEIGEATRARAERESTRGWGMDPLNPENQGGTQIHEEKRQVRTPDEITRLGRDLQLLKIEDYPWIESATSFPDHHASPIRWIQERRETPLPAHLRNAVDASDETPAVGAPTPDPNTDAAPESRLATPADPDRDPRTHTSDPELSVPGDDEAADPLAKLAATVRRLDAEEEEL